MGTQLDAVAEVEGSQIQAQLGQPGETLSLKEKEKGLGV